MKALKMMAGAGGRRNASMRRFSGCFVGKTWKHFRANLGVTCAPEPNEIWRCSSRHCREWR
jgi:hypothetical protein